MKFLTIFLLMVVPSFLYAKELKGYDQQLQILKFELSFESYDQLSQYKTTSDIAERVKNFITKIPYLKEHCLDTSTLWSESTPNGGMNVYFKVLVDSINDPIYRKNTVDLDQEVKRHFITNSSKISGAKYILPNEDTTYGARGSFTIMTRASSEHFGFHRPIVYDDLPVLSQNCSNGPQDSRHYRKSTEIKNLIQELLIPSNYSKDYSSSVSYRIMKKDTEFWNVWSNQ